MGRRLQPLVRKTHREKKGKPNKQKKTKKEGKFWKKSKLRQASEKGKEGTRRVENIILRAIILVVLIVHTF